MTRPGRTLCVLCRPETAAGFELTSLPVTLAPDVGAAIRTLEQLHEQDQVAVVLIEEELERNLPETLKRQLDRSQSPVLLPFPGPRWQGESHAEERIVTLLRRAIGYRVKL